MSLESDDPASDVAMVAAARDQLDRAMIAYNRHALLVDRYRRAVAAFQASRAAFERGLAEREEWRIARAAASVSREQVRVTVREYALRLRDEGVAPELMLVAVKARMRLCVTRELPAAPGYEASILEKEAATWAIDAYYDAA